MGFRGVLGHEFVGVVRGRTAGLARPARGRRDQLRLRALCHLRGAGSGATVRPRAVMGILDADGAFAEYVRGAGGESARRPRRRDGRRGRLRRAAGRGVRDRRAGAGGGAGALRRARRRQARPAGGAGAGRGRRARAGGRQARRQAGASCAGAASRRCVGEPGIAPPAMSSSRRPAAPPASSMAVAATRPRGTLVLKSTVAHARAAQSGAAGDQRDHRRRLALRAVRAGARRRWRAARSTCGR